MLNKEILKYEFNESLRNYRNHYIRNHALFLYPFTYFIFKSVYLAILVIMRENPIKEIDSSEKYGFGFIILSLFSSIIKAPVWVPLYFFMYAFTSMKMGFEI